MTEKYISQNIEHLKKQLEAEQASLDSFKRQVKNSENTINHLKEMIYNICEHEFVVDLSIYNEHTEFICRNCGYQQ
jgi:septation ring formation regulator EzrA